jgi:hypothetical protein
LRFSQQWLRRVLSSRIQPTFRREISPPSSWSNKPCKKSARMQLSNRLCSSEESVDFQQTARRYIAEASTCNHCASRESCHHRPAFVPSKLTSGSHFNMRAMNRFSFRKGSPKQMIPSNSALRTSSTDQVPCHSAIRQRVQFPGNRSRWGYVQAYLNPNLRQRASFLGDLCTKSGVCDFIWPPCSFSLKVSRQYRMGHADYCRYTLKCNYIYLLE